MLLAGAAAFLAGVSRTAARTANAQLAQRIGTLPSTCYNYVLGLLCSLVALLLSGEALSASALTGGKIPAWAYLGGAVGVLFVVLSNLTAPKLSAFSVTLLIFAGQLATGVALDAAIYGWLSFGKIAGGVLILLGLLLNLSLDEQDKRARAPGRATSRAHIAPIRHHDPTDLTTGQRRADEVVAHDGFAEIVCLTTVAHR